MDCYIRTNWSALKWLLIEVLLGNSNKSSNSSRKSRSDTTNNKTRNNIYKYHGGYIKEIVSFNGHNASENYF